jgi:hypothetical protein
MSSKTLRSRELEAQERHFRAIQRTVTIPTIFYPMPLY